MAVIIQIDSREKAKAIKKIEEEFDRRGVQHPVSKLMIGDYMNYDNPRVIVDRKQNLTEVCSNLTQQHERFRREAIKAQNFGIKLIILVEHSPRVKSIDDVEKWTNPRRYEYCKKYGIPIKGDIDAAIQEFTQHGGAKPPTSGEQLAKTMRTMSEKYGIDWEFCDKNSTGKRIIELLE